ncbi:hypothetical protein JCM10049v2_004592 [Rhodotorula toruloides]
MDKVEHALAFGWAHPILSAATLLLGCVVGYTVYLLGCSIILPRLSPLHDLPGPPPESLLYGNVKRILQDPPGVPHIEWNDKYGGVVQYRGFFGETRLLLFDPTALNHVLLSNAYDYPKPEEVRGDLALILGKGVLFAEGEDHRRQRRIMNPSFGPAHLRELVPSFFEHANELRDVWKDLIAQGHSDEKVWKDEEKAQEYAKTKPEGEALVNVIAWLNRLTLDIIGDAGFGYRFDAVAQHNNALGAAFSSMFSPRAAARKPTPYRIMLQRTIGFFVRKLPILKIADWVPNERFKQVREGFRTVQSESDKIIQLKMNDAVEKDGVESVRAGKDLIALLLKSTQGEGKAKMTQAELRGQLTTFLLAGHETTSTALTWTLLTLSRQPEAQEKLRQEIRAARRKARSEGREELESRELDALPYLDGVAREILRLEAPVSATVRHAGKDDFIPLGTPVRSRYDPDRLISSIPIKKGQTVFIPILAVNRSKKIFGDDAHEFKPERWMQSENGEGKKIEGGVGVYSQILTFLAGPRSCIGYKFAVLELKAILSVLIDNFEFSLRDPAFEVEHRSIIVTRPLVVGEETDGNKMPLRVRLAERDEE